MTKLVFLDTETTGLELHHDIWEVAWAVGGGPIKSAIVPHSLKGADPAALKLNGYDERFPDGARASDPFIDVKLRQVFEGKTIVGANPAFDTVRLQLRWGAQPWHYRLLDISSMATQAFGLREDGRPPGLLDVRNLLLERFEDEDAEIPLPDHTAAGDVATLRGCYAWLRKLRA